MACECKARSFPNLVGAEEGLAKIAEPRTCLDYTVKPASEVLDDSYLD